MIDFPANPTLGQQFTAAGVTWTWDGVKWTPGGLGQAYLPLAGGALTGDLSIASPDGNNLALSASGANWPGVKFNITAGKGAWLGSYVGANERWELDLGNGVAESGNNAGSNFQIARYADNGAFIDDPLVINRQSGILYTNAISAPNVIGENKIINGDMRTDQRNNGATTAAIGYTLDRWSYSASQALNILINRNANGAAGFSTTGFPYFLLFRNSSVAYASLPSDYFQLTQTIEADMVSDFRWGTANAQPVTLSFWVLAGNFTGTLSGCIGNYAATRSYPFTFPVTNAWTKVSITIPGDTAGTWVTSGNGGSVVLHFDLGTGTTYRGPAGAWAATNYVGATGAASVVGIASASLSLTGVKLEIGSVATPFNRQSLAKVFADCQRYYQTGQWQDAGFGEVGATDIFTMNLPTVMRATPTITYDLSLGTANISTAAPALLSSSTLQIACSVAANGGFAAGGNYFVTAEL